MVQEFPPRRRSFSRICFIGDAFTVGAGDDTVLGWVGRLALAEWQHNHDVTIYNLGIRGASTRTLRHHWRGECEARLPQGCNGRLVFMFGGNDAKEVVGTGVEVPIEESVANARAMLAEAAAWLPTLWVSLIPMSATRPYPRLLPDAPEYRFDNQRQAAYTQRYAKVARELAVPFLDIHTPLLHDPAWQDLTQAGDGSNPNAQGYARIAALISAWPAWRAWFDGA
jgi:lysophospholipase L1-like esterase